MASAGSVEDLQRRRAALLDDSTLTGRAFVTRYTELVDGWLRALFDDAVGADSSGLALVAVGGYGRAELCPASDLDLLFVHRPERAPEALADRLWYPVWDAGLHLGHAVRTPGEALALARDDLDTATSLLDVRHLAGDGELTASLATSALVHWRRGGSAWLDSLRASVRARHAATGEVAFLLEPDLKAGRGGLRDVHALQWVSRLLPDPLPIDHAALAGAYETLLEVRVELHRRNRGRGEVLLLQEQDAIAAALGDRDADALLGRVAGAGRLIAWIGDDAWEQLDHVTLGPRGVVRRRRGRRRAAEEPPVQVAPGIVRVAGRVQLSEGASPAQHPELVLELAAAAATSGVRMAREALVRCVAEAGPAPDPWPSAMRDAFVRLLLAGPGAVTAIEDLDQHGLWVGLLPEWALVRNRPQRNAYHRFTVDRHLVETCAEAAGLAGRVERPDLLVLGALLHDLGKGSGGDHSATGAALAATVVTRLGYDPSDVELVKVLVRHHLLLPEVATRRDLADPSTITRVAEAVGDTLTLHLLEALAEADGLATGPAAWSSWKATLIRELVRRVDAVLNGADGTAGALLDDFPTPAELELLAARSPCLRTEGPTLTLVAADRPGLFSRVAGVLSLHGLQVVAAGARSDDAGWALERFRVAAMGEGAPRAVRPEERWEAVRADLERVLEGRLALHARLAERARAYRPARRSARTGRSRVVVDNEASALATVLEVHAPDSVGLLYRITAALAELDLDLRTARIETLGDEVVDVFYVRGVHGAKITDPDHLAEVERALLFAVDFT